MKRVGTVVAIKREMCSVEFETKVGCCGGRKRADGSPSCGDSVRILSFNAHRGQHKEVKVGDRVVVENNTYMVWWQALVGLIIPSILSLYFFFGLHCSWLLLVSPLFIAWGILVLTRLVCGKSAVPVITEVNPFYLVQDEQ